MQRLAEDQLYQELETLQNLQEEPSEHAAAIEHYLSDAAPPSSNGAHCAPGSQVNEPKINEVTIVEKPQDNEVEVL